MLGRYFGSAAGPVGWMGWTDMAGKVLCSGVDTDIGDTMAWWWISSLVLIFACFTLFVSSSGGKTTYF